MSSVINNYFDNVNIKWNTNPFPHVVIDNFLPIETFEKISLGLDEVRNFKSIRAHFTSYLANNKKVYGDEDLNENLKLPISILGGKDLTKIFESYSVSLPSTVQDDLSMANLRSRIRMSNLYVFASNYQYLVVGTGNKVEDFGVGFYTKYGDGGVDISPIADLLKSEVFSLAKHLGMLPSIQNASPTDGLWDDDRNDEDQLGATYEELEWAMHYIEAKSSSTLSEREKSILNIYNKHHKTNQHKMLPIPVCNIPGELTK